MMKKENKQSCGCDSSSDVSAENKPAMEVFPIYRAPAGSDACCEQSADVCTDSTFDEPCCGPPAGPPSSPDERPGYDLRAFVTGFLDTEAGRVPQVKTVLDRWDWLGTLKVRLSFGRDAYKVAPGLYAVGQPDADSPVLVTANYKLSFDHLRRNLGGRNAWLLVLDTRGINVWCAAGKGTFGTSELIRQVRLTNLSRIVKHRKLILPQLGATGIAGGRVKFGCGFEVVWGPILAEDINAFIDGGFKATESMRRVTFTLKERLVLIPVEIALIRKPLLWTLLAVFFVSGIGRHFFSVSAAWERGLLAVTACLTGIVAGCIAAPLLLPWLPGRAFAIKGAVTGLVLSIAIVVWFWASPYIAMISATALILCAVAISSYLAMNFTGSTPFTSPSGVEKEMRRAIPLQLVAAVLAVVFWIGAGFTF
jgi:hypothetical protein